MPHRQVIAIAQTNQHGFLHILKQYVQSANFFGQSFRVLQGENLHRLQKTIPAHVMREIAPEVILCPPKGAR